MHETQALPVARPVDVDRAKAAYSAPLLRVYGSVSKLTRSGTGSGSDGGVIAGMTMPSDRAIKENIVRIGTHPLGVGLYLFDYIAQYRQLGQAARNFGVMADEVEAVLPEAVGIHANGYKAVNYAMLGITMAELRFN